MPENLTDSRLEPRSISPGNIGPSNITPPQVSPASLRTPGRAGRNDGDDGSVLGVASRFLTGILHGFTTVNIDRSEPANVAEGLAQSLGTWIGITGSFVPIGRAVRTGGAAATRFISRGASRQTGMHAGRQARQAQQARQKMPNLTSVPIGLGNMAVRGAKAGADRLATPAGRRWAANNRLTLDALEGTGRIGVAMGSLGWQEGIDGMLTGAAFGSFFGGTDRIIGNTVRQMRPTLQRMLRSGSNREIERAERAVGMVSAGIVSGMPSTIMGMPWEYQVYDYLFGAWLGAEPPYHRRAAHQFLDKIRHRGQEHDIMDPARRSQNEEYQKLMDRHKNPKVRQGLAEEIESQVDFRFGQMMNAYPRAAYILAAAQGQPSEQVMTELADSKFANEVYNSEYQRGVREGLNEDQASERAMDETRSLFVRWKKGEINEPQDLQIREEAEPWKPNVRGYRLYQPVKMPARGGEAEQTGIITSVDTKGLPLEVTAFDGTKLLIPGSKGKPRRATTEEITNQRENLRHRYSAIDRDQFEIMAANESDETPIPKEVWDRYPSVRDRYTQVRAYHGSDGEWYATVNLGRQEISRSGPQASEADAVRAGEDMVREIRLSETSRQVMDMNDASDVWKMISDHEDITTLVEVASIKDIARQINEAEGVTDSIGSLGTYRKLLQMVDSHTSEVRPGQGNRAWQDFTENLSSIFPKYGKQIQQDPTQIRSFRQWFKRRSYELPKKKTTWRDGEVVMLQDHYFDGKHARETKAPSFLDRTLQNLLGSDDSHVLHIDRVEGLLESGQPYSSTLADGNITKDDFYRMTVKLATDSPMDRPYYVMGGVKDKDTLKALPVLFDTPDAARSYLQPRLSEMGRSFRRSYQAEKDQFVSETLKHIDPASFRGQALPMEDGSYMGILQDQYGQQVHSTGPHRSENAALRSVSRMRENPDFIRRRIEDMFDGMFASEIRVWEAMNHNKTGRHRYPIKHLSQQGMNFLTTRAQRNKRLQIMDADGMLADREFYQDISDFRDNFKALIVNTVNTDGSSHAEGVQEYYLRSRDSEGRAQDRQAKEHRDGVVLVRPDVYDRMVSDSGGAPDGSALKGFTAFGDKHGMFLGKYALFRAEGGEADFMSEQGAHMLYYTDSVKQQGSRTSYNMTVGKDGAARLWSDRGRKTVKKPQLYDVPVDGITFTLGKSDIPSKALSPQKLPVQALQNMMPHLIDSNVSKNTAESILNEAMASKPYPASVKSEIDALAETQASEMHIRELREKVKNIDVDEIGVHDIGDIIRGDNLYVQTGLYDRVVRHIMKTSDRSEDFVRGDDPDDIHDIAFNEYKSSADVLFESMGDQPITPSMLFSRGFRRLFDEAYGQYVTSRIKNPKMDYSMKSIGAGQSGWFLQDHQLSKGQFMLGQAARNMKVRAFGEDMTLGRAWDNMQSDQAQLRQAQQQLVNLQRQGQDTTKARQTVEDLQARVNEYDDIFTMVVTRVPIEHASGVRALRFAGFSNDQGTTSKLHPEDMANLGGMDLDIDDVFIFQNLGKEHHMGVDGKQKRLVDELQKPEVRDRWLDEDGAFLDQKENVDLFDVQLDTDTNYAKMFSPQANYDVSRNTAKMNKALGIFANTKRDVTTYISALDGATEHYTINQFMKLTGKKKKPKWAQGATEIAIRADMNRMPLVEETGRTAINLAADASDILSMKDPMDIMRDMFAQGVHARVKVKGKWKDVTIDTSPVYQQLKRASQFMGGRDHSTGRKYKKAEIVYGLRDVEARLQNITQKHAGRKLGLSDMPGSFYRSAFRMSETDIDYQPLNHMSMKNLEQLYDVYNSVMNESTTIGELTKRFTGGLKNNRRYRNISKKGFIRAAKRYQQEINKAGLDPQQRQRIADDFIDFLGNDMASMVSAVSLYREAGRLYHTYDGQTLSNGRDFNIYDLHTIADDVTSFKWNFYHLMREKDARTASQYNKALEGVRQQPFQSIASLNDAIADYRAALPKEYRRYFDFYGMSTLVSNNVKQKFLTNNPFYTHMSPENIRDFYGNHEALWQMASRDISRDEFINVVKGNKDWLSLLNNERSGDMVPNRQGVNHTVGQMKHLRERQMPSEDSAPEVPVASEHESYRTQREIMQELEASRDFEFTTEEQQLVDDLRELFRRHPIIEKHFTEIFAGEQAWNLQRLGRKAEAATMEDIRDFLGIMRGFRHGNLFQEAGSLGPTVDRWMYWMMPNRYHERLAKFDLQTQQVYNPVLGLDGTPRMEATRILTSTPDNLRKSANTAQLAEQVITKMVNSQFSEKHKPLEEGLGQDHELIWNYTVHMREKRRKDIWSEYSRREFNRLEHEVRKLSGKKYKIDGEDHTLNQAISRVDRFITEQNQWVWDNVVQGRDRSKYEAFRYANILDTDNILSMIHSNLVQGDPANVDLFGVDLLHQTMHQYSMERRLLREGFEKGSHRFEAELQRLLEQYPYQPLTELGHEAYYPHNNFDPATLKHLRIKRWNELLQSGMHEDQARGIINQEIDQGIAGDVGSEANFNDMVATVLQVTDQQLDGRRINKLRSTEIPGSLKGRERVKPETGEGRQLSGWDPDITSIRKYQDTMVQSMMRKAVAASSAKQIDDFEARMVEREPDTITKGGRHAWSDFMRLYIRDQVGATTEIPSSWRDAYPDLNIRASGYEYFTDSFYRELDAKVAKKLGTRPLLQENDPRRPFRLVSLSNMEAKYSLLTLLSRPKTLMTNLYGGTQLSAIDLGLKGYMRGWQLSELKKLDPTKETLGDWMRFAEDHGAMESLIRNEIMATPQWRVKRNQQGLTAMLNHLTRNPSAADESLWEIGRKYGLTDAVMDAAAFPMRYSERKLRTHAFLSHMMKAADIMEVSGRDMFDHPWVLEMARRGTVSSQFLYNNANRPSFTRTNMGKIFSRFKLWAFNSVQFRRLAQQRAGEVGYRQGSEPHQRFERMVVSDMFMMGLAMMFPFSLFDTALPEPYGWLKDLVEWGFGDEEQKETAFFGALPSTVAPLNIALPPSSRLLSTWFKPMLTGEWENFTGYHVWSLFPFGLLTRDIRGAMQDPSYSIDRMTGVPVGQIGSRLSSPFDGLTEQVGTGIRPEAFQQGEPEVD